MRFSLARDFRFESARSLPNLPAGHPCGNVHGHSFVVTVEVVGDNDPQIGWVMDFAAIDEIVEPSIKVLDHAFLNDIDGLANPTSEHIAAWLWNRAKPALPELASITVAETIGTRCTYRGE